jgi:hypothetical protein
MFLDLQVTHCSNSSLRCNSPFLRAIVCRPVCLPLSAILGPVPRFCYCQFRVADVLRLTDERTGVWFTVILGSESCRIHDRNILSQIPQHGGPDPHIHPPRTGWPTYTLDTALFSMPFTTGRATVKLFDCTSTRETA